MATCINIPYRCPDCGENEKFSTLQELRIHLQNEHPFLVGRSYHATSSSNISQLNRPNKCSLHSSLLELYHTDAKILEEVVNRTKEEELNNKRCRSHYAGSISKVNTRDYLPRATFREYGHSSRIMKKFFPKNITNQKLSKFENLCNKPHDSSDEDKNSSSSLFADTQFMIMDNNLPGNMNKEALYREAPHSNNEIRTYNDSCLQQPNSLMTNDKHVINTLTALSHNVLLQRASQCATANSLYTTQEILSGIEQAAEDKVIKQQHLIDTLAQELKEKERKLTSVMKEMESLHNQQLAIQETVSLSNQTCNHEKTHSYQELNKKQLEIDCTNKQNTEENQSANINGFQKSENKLSDAKSGQNKLIYTNLHSISPTMTENVQGDKVPRCESIVSDKEFGNIKEKSAKLEQDRQILITEMHNLLATAAMENDKLRAQLEERNQKLSKLNNDLKQSKQDQEELLGETNTLYHQADVSLSLLKTMLKERDEQLKHMSSSIEQAKTSQEKLEKEKNEYLKLSLERETMYKSMLAANSSQVKSVKEILQLSQEEKLRLYNELHNTRERLTLKTEEDKLSADKISQLQAELALKEKTFAEMKEKIRRREDKLRKARREMERVTTYLKITADKEMEARSSLETFISGLFNRAGKAEAELQKVKSDQTTTFAKNVKSTPVFQDKTKFVSNDSASCSIPQMTSHATSHLELPDMIISQDRKQRLFEHTLPSGKQNTEQLKEMHYQLPRSEEIYKRSYAPDISICSSSLQQKAHNLHFENTPEIEKMILNVNKFESSGKSHPLYSQTLHRIEEDRLRQNMPAQRQENLNLPLDSDGIMWREQMTAAYYQKNSKSKYNHRPSVKQRIDHLKTNDDTDVDEDLTDCIHDEDFNSQKKSHKVGNITKQKVISHNSVSQMTVTAHQQSPVPLDEKVVKLLSSLEHDNFHGSKLSVAQEIKSPQQNNASNRDNDYSTTDSFEISPLQKARAVQKRVEQLTTFNSNSFPSHFSSMQLVTPQINQLDQESDFSSSSYVSLGQTHNLSLQNQVKQCREDLQCQAPTHIDLSTDVNSDQDKKLHCKEALDKDHLEYNKVFIEPRPAITGVIIAPSSDNVTDLPIAHVAEACSILENNKHLEKQLSNTCQKDITESPNCLEDHAIGEDASCHVVQDEEMATLSDTTMRSDKEMKSSIMNHSETQVTLSSVCQRDITESPDSLQDHVLVEDSCHTVLDDELVTSDATVRSGKELKTVIMNHTETQVSSSEEDLCDDSSRKKSVDATTDTDLEKLSMPGHLQRGFVVRKVIPNRKHFTRKKSRRRPLVRSFQSQESLSSGPEETDNAERTNRQAVRKMRIALFRVFSYLDTRSLLTVSCVSKEWNRVSRHPALWKHVRLSNSTISSSFLITLSNWCTQTRSLSLEGLHGRSIRAEETPEDYQQAIRGSIEPGLEKLLSTCHDTLTVVYISDCDNILTDKCLWLVSGYCRLLTSLTYRSCRDPVSPQLIWALGAGCPGITSLFVHPVQPCEKKDAMNNKCLLLIGQLYPDIQELGLGGKEFDKAGLLHLIQSCQRLKSLHMDHCLSITTDLAVDLCTAGLKFLQRLRISGTYVEAKAIQKFKECCRQLNSIYISVKIEDCVNDPNKKKDKEAYKKMVKALEVLRPELGFGISFTLEAAPVN